MAIKHPKRALEGLLDSYDAERRPIGERVAKTSLYNMRAHALVLDEAIGLSPTKSEADNMRAMDEYFDASDKHRGLVKRQEVDKAMEALDVEFYAHGAEVGWFYDFDYKGTYGDPANKDANPQLKPDGEMELCAYHPSIRPGSQLPHTWLIDEGSSKRISSRALMVNDKLVLLGMSASWRKITHPLLEVKIDGHGGDLLDSKRAWKELWGDAKNSGALIVRPDTIIAYRFPNDDILQEADLQAKIGSIVETALMLAR